MENPRCAERGGAANCKIVEVSSATAAAICRNLEVPSTTVTTRFQIFEASSTMVKTRCRILEVSSEEVKVRCTILEPPIKIAFFFMRVMDHQQIPSGLANYRPLEKLWPIILSHKYSKVL
jgi:hypothetical protein